MYTKQELEKASLLAGLQLYGLPIYYFRPGDRDWEIVQQEGFLARCKEFGINPEDHEKESICYKNIQTVGFPANSGLMWCHENTVIETTVAAIIAEMLENTGETLPFGEAIDGDSEYIFNPETGEGTPMYTAENGLEAERPENWVNGKLYVYSACAAEIYVISK